jgi:hypothetical protein
VSLFTVSREVYGYGHGDFTGIVRIDRGSVLIETDILPTIDRSDNFTVYLLGDRLVEIHNTHVFSSYMKRVEM